DGVRGLEDLDPIREFGSPELRLRARLRTGARKAALEQVTQGGQLGQVGFVREWLAEPGLVITQLRLRDAEVLPDAVAVGAIGVGQALQRVQHSPRPLVLP